MQVFTTPPNRQQTTFAVTPPISLPACVDLDLEELQGFEVVNAQFRHLGITFSNAIALKPSNPAYPVRSGKILLLGAPKSGLLEATFEQPVQFVRGYFTSSRQLVMSAYDRDDNLLAQTETPGANLAGSGSPVPPNAELSLHTPGIHRIVCYAFGGELTVDDISFQH